MGKLIKTQPESGKQLLSNAISLSLKNTEKSNNTVLPSKSPTPKDYQQMSDLDLVNLFQQTNDMNILVVLLDRYDRYIVAITIRLIHLAEEIKDIKQDLFIKLAEKLKKQI